MVPQLLIFLLTYTYNDFPRYRNYKFLIAEVSVSDQFFLLSFLYKV